MYFFLIIQMALRILNTVRGKHISPSHPLLLTHGELRDSYKYTEI